MQEKTREALAASGIDVRQLEESANSASRTVGEATKVATPTLTKIVNFLTTSSPETLGKVALAAVAIYFLTPIAVKLFFSSLRGYAGVLAVPSKESSRKPCIAIGRHAAFTWKIVIVIKVV
jgi:hypothetical protein